MADARHGTARRLVTDVAITSLADLCTASRTLMTSQIAADRAPPSVDLPQRLSLH